MPWGCAFILQKPEKRRRPIRWVGITWFVLIFALAFVYSLLREPIIQYSTMIFCYPFLILTAFSLYKNVTMTMTQTGIVVAVILFIGAMSLIINRQYYDLMYHQGYDQIAQRMQEDNDNFKDISFATSTSNVKFPEFYQAKTKVNDRAIFGFYSNNNTSDLRRWIAEKDTRMLGFGWTDYIDPAWEAQAVAYYPWKLREDTWFTSRYLTLSKDSVPGATYMLHPLSNDPVTYYNSEWGKAHYISGDSLDSNTDLLGIIATIQTSDTITDCILVMEIHDKDTDTLIQWHGNASESGTLLPGTNIMANAIRFDSKTFPIHGKNIKTYLWDKNKGTMIVTRFDYYCTRFNSRLTGLYEPL